MNDDVGAKVRQQRTWWRIITAGALICSLAALFAAIYAGSVTTAAAAALAVLVVLLHSTRGRYLAALEASERHHRALVDMQPELISLATEAGDFTYVNPAYARFFERDASALLGSSLFDLVDERDRAAVRTLIERVLRDGATGHGENRVILPDGSRRWVAWSNSLQSGPQGERLLCSVGRDVTQRRQLEDDLAAHQRRLQAQTEALRSITEAIPTLVAVVGADGRYRMINGAFERWVGLPRERVLGHTVEQVLGAVDARRIQPWLERALNGESVSFEREYATTAGTRHFIASYVPLRLDDGTVDGFVGVLQDISDHRREEVRLLQLSQVDPLTAVLNRAGLEQSLTGALRDGRSASTALLFIDLDRFKPVNDAFGHAVGDEVLRQFAQRLRGVVRPTDAVARFGGDEFVVLLDGVREREHAQAVARKVTQAAEQPFDVEGRQIHIGASVGVAWGNAADGSVADLVGRADAMLYRAKRAGRGRHASEGGG